MNKSSQGIMAWVRIIFYLSMTLVLAGCGSVGVISSQMKLNAAQYLNPDVNGQAAPVLVTFYELKSAVSFKQADYFQLQNNAGSVLGENLLDKQSIEMRPGQQLSYPLTMPDSVRYIGITAGYRDIDQSKWRATVQVPKLKSHWYTFGKNSIRIKVNLLSEGISVQLNK